MESFVAGAESVDERVSIQSVDVDRGQRDTVDSSKKAEASRPVDR